MRLDTLRKALKELKLERERIEAAIRGLGSLLNSLDDPKESHPTKSLREFPEPTKVVSGSYIDLGVKALEMAGKPLRMKELVQEISRLKGRDLERKSVEASLHKHISRTGKRARIVRIRPGVYDLQDRIHRLALSQ